MPGTRLCVGARPDGAAQGGDLPTPGIVEHRADSRSLGIRPGGPIGVQPRRSFASLDAVLGAVFPDRVFPGPGAQEHPPLCVQAVERPDDNAVCYHIENIDAFGGDTGKDPGS